MYTYIFMFSVVRITGPEQEKALLNYLVLQIGTMTTLFRRELDPGHVKLILCN